MKNLTEKELRKRPERAELFLEKYSAGQEFHLMTGETVRLLRDEGIIEAIRRGDDLSDLTFRDVSGSEYRLEQIAKTREFGGREPLARETNVFQNLRRDLARELRRSGTPHLRLKFGTIQRNVSSIHLGSGKKSDFHFSDPSGKPVIWLSHKHGSLPRHFQQWSGISLRKSQMLFLHDETKQFISDIKKKFKHFPPATSLHRKISDDALRGLAIYGEDYGLEYSDSNVNGIIQGDARLVRENENCYSLSGQKSYNGQTLAGTPYEPVLMAIYKGADRNDGGIRGCRLTISPIQSRKSIEF